MFCTTCGGTLTEGQRYCPACGADSLPPSAAVVNAPERTARFTGSGGELFVIVLVNALLTFVTLGIYYFWGKAKVRQFTYGNTEFDGERFQFHGTGKEMFLGWLRFIGIALLVAIVFGVAAVASGGDELFTVVAGLVNLGILIGVVPFALVGTARYRLSRTSWRGIRFSFRGSFEEFFPVFLKAAALTFLTLGIYTPFAMNDVRGYFTSRTRWGTQPFSYTGSGDDLFGAWIKAFLLMIVTLGVYRYWWTATWDRYSWSNSTFGPVSFRSSVDGGSLLWLTFTNFLLVAFTLGIGMPWAMVRLIEYRIARLHVTGTPNYAAIQQQMQQASALGEEVGDALDMDFGVGL